LTRSPERRRPGNCDLVASVLILALIAIMLPFRPSITVLLGDGRELPSALQASVQKVALFYGEARLLEIPGDVARPKAEIDRATSTASSWIAPSRDLRRAAPTHPHLQIRRPILTRGRTGGALVVASDSRARGHGDHTPPRFGRGTFASKAVDSPTARAPTTWPVFEAHAVPWLIRGRTLRMPGARTLPGPAPLRRRKIRARRAGRASGEQPHPPSAAVQGAGARPRTGRRFVVRSGRADVVAPCAA